jgi:hypothetical protein
MEEIQVDLYECRNNCHLIFSVERPTEVTCCPRCGKENPTCVGGGVITEIFEH